MLEKLQLLERLVAQPLFEAKQLLLYGFKELLVLVKGDVFGLLPQGLSNILLWVLLGCVKYRRTAFQENLTTRSHCFQFLGALFFLGRGNSFPIFRDHRLAIDPF